MTTTLPNFPLVSQLSQITSDGRPSENAQFDCVPASIGACILWYQQKSQWDSQINPDHLKDLAYNEDLQNSGTSATDYVPVIAKLGYNLTPIENASNRDAVAKAHQLLAEQKPVIFTMLDHYVDLSKGWTHVCVWYADQPGSLVAMDPFIANSVSYSDARWESELRSAELWIVEPNVAASPQALAQAGWHDDGTTLKAPNGLMVVKGFRQWVLTHDWDPQNLPLENEHWQDPLEVSNPSLGKGSQQAFRWTVLEWSQKDNRVYEMWTGQELLELRKEGDDLTQQVQALQQQIAALTGHS